MAYFTRRSWIRCNGNTFDSFEVTLQNVNPKFSHSQHTDPDYSCVYVTIKTNESIEGYGLTFTCGRGNEIVRMGVKALSTLIVGRHLRNDIYARFGMFWREITSETQLRWVSLFKQLVSKFGLCHFYRNM